MCVQFSVVCIMHRAQFLPCVKWQTARRGTVVSVLNRTHRVSSGRPRGTVVTVLNRYTPCVKWQTARRGTVVSVLNRYTPCVKWQTARYGSQCTEQKHTVWQNAKWQQPSVTFKCCAVQSKAKPWDKHEQRKRNYLLPFSSGPGWLSRYSDSLRAGRSGDLVPEGARFSAPVKTGPGTLLYNG